MNFKTLLCLCLALSVRHASPAGTPPGGSEQNAAASEVYYSEPFENAEKVPTGWEIQGDVVVAVDELRGNPSLRLTRAKEKFDAAVEAVSPAVSVSAGKAEIGGAFRAALVSPDNSFNAAIQLECLDAHGKGINTLRVAEFYGNANWSVVAKPVEIPEGTAKVRLRIALNKATGQFWADDLSIKSLASQAAAASPVKRIILKTATLGNLFHPGDPAVFDVTVESSRPLPPENRTLLARVTDYWGAEQADPMPIALAAQPGSQKSVFTYGGRIDLTGLKFDTGAYYELRVKIDPGSGEPEREFSSFAFLPEAVTKKYPPSEIPFSSRNWDNRIPAYFELTDRLGIRLAGIWGSWKQKPPYEPAAPCWELSQKLNLGTLSNTPMIRVEHQWEGYEKYTGEPVIAGIPSYIEKYGSGGQLAFTLGNEPPPSGPIVERNVGLYQRMYEQIKKTSPGTFVLGTSVGPEEEYFKYGFQKYCDAVDFHTYEDSNGIRATFEKYKELFSKYGSPKPIWSTEMGLNSQGLPRRAVAAELIKKFSWFFSFGGANASWFTICYPDREGRLRGAADDSHNVFNGLYGNYAPRLDALAYYNMVNGICIKKFADSRQYPGEIHAFLFLDKNGDNFQVLWKDRGAADVFVPLPGVAEAKMTRIDGTGAQLAASGKGLTLRVGEDPLLLTYNGGQKTLPAQLGKPLITVTAVPEKITRGESAPFALACHGISARDIRASLPPSWKASEMQAVGDEVRFTVTAPAGTEARYVPVRVSVRSAEQGDADLAIVLPVQGQLTERILPVSTEDGTPAVELVVRNNNQTPETIDWKLTLPREVPLHSGRYSLEDTRPPGAYFSQASEGRHTIAPREEAKIRMPLAGVNPLSAYKVRATVTDRLGRADTSERFVGGFVSAPKAPSGMEIDGALEEAIWKRSKPVRIDQKEQFFSLGSKHDWSGPADLSGEVRFLWDQKYFYIGAKVQDNVFRNETAGGSEIWRGDGLQLLIDPARGSKEKPGKYDYALGIGKSGPSAWCYLSADGRAPAGAAKDIVIAAKRASDGTGGMTYEIAIPWERLAPFLPGIGANLGLAVILNDDDSAGRDRFMTWFGDIQTKEVDPVGDVILTE
ncbi:MAG: sugar-binding protein [Chthoniobacteraceae bacterium]|nr:sugar-binding protein [Chthoniobacteraceae bacterium]